MAASNEKNLMEDVKNEQEERETIESFGINFNKRYESLLGFQAVTFQKMIDNFLKCEIQERRVLAIYLHNDNHVGSHVFADAIAKAYVTEYLNEKFTIWGFDCTSKSNAKYMQKLLKDNSINYDLENPKSSPALLIVGRFYAANEIIRKLTIDTSTSDIRAELENSYNEFLRRNNENVDLLDFTTQVSFEVGDMSKINK